jgi:RNA polymerase sigma-70 factor, ECF subfamily
LQGHETISELMDTYGTSILHLAYSFVRNRQTAEDLSQEIFIKAYQKLDTFQGSSSIKTWLYRIAINHCKDYVKSWHYRKVHTLPFLTSILKGQQNGAETQYFNKLNQSELIDDIHRLPLKYREVIVLTYFHELKLSEISTVIGVNTNTLKSRIVKARKLLRLSISERSVEDEEPIEGNKSGNVTG